MVKRFIQTYKIDYNKTFTFIIKLQSYKVIWAYATFLDQVVKMINVATAFLYREVEEKIYVI